MNLFERKRVKIFF